MKRPAPTGTERFLKEDDFIVSKTDLKGRIIYGNKMFIKISGYSESELLGAPHSILRHPDMPKIVFKLLWDRIQNGEEIFAYVKNLCKDGGFYWVFANVTATPAPDGSTRDYHSVRRKPSAKALEVIPGLYAQLLEAEKSGGMEASGRLLNEILNEKGVSYDEFVLSLQQ
ncbi:PAS domain-containing protein [Hydrogenimonas sp. SS33]|uniref:PAS domain-containing protein n=1 Tax=Hydrogenimonas leucolamina TaxID=2954236 RepID=UPI00336BEF5C